MSRSDLLRHGNNTDCDPGSNADNILADAYVKGLRGGINWTAGYQAMLKDAEIVPYNTFSPLDMTGSVKEGRGALFDWVPLGYLSQDGSARSLSRTVEYALNDFALYQVALGRSPRRRPEIPQPLSPVAKQLGPQRNQRQHDPLIHGLPDTTLTKWPLQSLPGTTRPSAANANGHQSATKPPRSSTPSWCRTTQPH